MCCWDEGTVYRTYFSTHVLIDGACTDEHMRVRMGCSAAWSGYRAALLFPRTSCAGSRFRIDGTVASTLPRIAVSSPFSERNHHVPGPRHRHASPGGISVQVSRSNQSVKSISQTSRSNWSFNRSVETVSQTGPSNQSVKSVRWIKQWVLFILN